MAWFRERLTTPGRGGARVAERAERDATLEEGATAALEPSRVALHQHDDLFGVLRLGNVLTPCSHTRFWQHRKSSMTRG